MPVIVMNIITPPDASKDEITLEAIHKISLGTNDVLSSGIYKSSLDARKRSEIHLVSSVMLTLKSDKLEKKLSEKRKDVRYFEEISVKPAISPEKRSGRVVIAGFGPAGMFCALLLSEYGYRPIVLERGDEVGNRVEAVKSFWSGNPLDKKTNVQFGEGGAGTFSDGKLTTRIGDPLARYVLKKFCEFGAPEEIMSCAKPHVGTDKLRNIVKGIRLKIIENGGEVRFLSKLEEISLNGGSVLSIKATDCEINTSALVLAIGHSARDTFKMLLNNGIVIQPKPFSVGARIEHTQKSVDESLYGEYAGCGYLPKGEYQLSQKA